ncbi:MAG: hypothetical protein WC641_05220 [Patescibacteria group bacterium]
MKKHIKFTKLTATCKLSELIRCIPDDWILIDGYLLAPNFPTSADSVTQNVLYIGDKGCSLHKGHVMPDLSALFAWKQDIDKVVFDLSGRSIKECRSLASDLVERGYWGIVTFSKPTPGMSSVPLLSAGLSIQRPADTSDLHLYADPNWLYKDMDQILRVCKQLAA